MSIETRHRRTCRSTGGGACNCRPGYRAIVYDAAAQRKISRTFPTLAAAKQWRSRAHVAVADGQLTASTSATLREVAEKWLEDAEAGVELARGGTRYKPASIRRYRAYLRLYVFPEFGNRRLSAITRRDVQQLIDRLHREGLAPTTVEGATLPLRAIYRGRDDIPINPCSGIRLPAKGPGRDRIAHPEEARSLLAALPGEDRALWATAMYAGLRRGELRALRWRDVDLEKRLIRVERGWDDVEGPIDPKSYDSRRTVPLSGTLRPFLLEQKLRTAHRGGDDLVFGQDAQRPFRPDAIRHRALRSWGWHRQTIDGKRILVRGESALEPITLHECRHTFASMMIAAGVNAKSLQTFMGHDSIQTTFDKYGHLMPGGEAAAAELLDTYLAAAR